MNKLIAITVVLASLGISAIGQIMPRSAYVAQPSTDGWRIRVYWTDHLVWPTEAVFEAEIGETGTILSMMYRGGSADMGTSFEYEYPTTTNGTTKAFKDLAGWKKFASKVHAEFARLGNDMYAEKTPFVFIGRSLSIDHWETPDSLQALVFRKGDRVLSIPMTSWVGLVPSTVGSPIIVGQTGRGEHFFQVIEVSGEYRLPEVTEKALLVASSNDNVVK